MNTRRNNGQHGRNFLNGDEGMANSATIENNKNMKRKRDWGETVFICLMLAYPLAHFLVFWLYVNFDTFRLTFFHFNTETAVYEWFGIERFKILFKDMFMGEDPMIQNNLRNSLICFPVQNFIILPLSFFVAFLLSKQLAGTSAYRVIFFLPSILSIVVLAMSYRFMFDADFGPINHALANVFGLDVDWFSSLSPTAMPLVFLFGIWAGLGYNSVLINGAIKRIPQEIFEAAKLDGVGLWREMFQMVLPLTMPTVTTLFIIGSMSIFGYYLQPMLLCGETGGVNGSTGTIALRVMQLMQGGDTESAAALGLFFSLLGVPFVLFIKWFMEKITPDVDF